MQVERGIERGPGGRDDHREVGGAAARKDGTGGHPLQRRLTHRRRDGAEGHGDVGSAEHRLDPLRRRRHDGQAVGPAPLEHLLDVVGAGGGGHRRRQLRVDGRLGRTPRLEQRLGGFRDREFGAEERCRLPDEGCEGLMIPAGHAARDRPGPVDENRGRHRDQLVGA